MSTRQTSVTTEMDEQWKRETHSLSPIEMFLEEGPS